MNPIYKQTGGGYAADEPQTRITGPQNPPSGATWPFVTISLFNDHIELKVMGSLYSVPLSEIDSVHRITTIPVVGEGVQIVHRSSAPKILVFWSLFGQRRLLKEFNKLGVSISERQFGSPTMQPNKSQKWRILIIAIVAIVILFLTIHR